jgi:chorismate synthase
MSGNSFGRAFKVTTFGESHGSALGAVIDGCPPRIELSEKDFEPAMARRRPGRSAHDSPRKEKDRVEILSGVFKGKTTGTPIGLLIRNHDVDSRPYEILEKCFRPGHADLPYLQKFGHYDHRGGGRASARETAARVAAGVIAQKVVKPLGVDVCAYTVEMGGIRAERFDSDSASGNPFSCPDPEAANAMARLLEEMREDGDTVGGVIETRIEGCPAGLGEPVFDKLDAELAKAFMSVGAVKGVEIGDGFRVAGLKGSVNNDPIIPEGFASNHAGGILGGISNGDVIVVRAAIKPIPSIRLPQKTVDRDFKPVNLELSGRFDVCAAPRIVPVLEAMATLVIADHYLRWRAQCGTLKD